MSCRLQRKPYNEAVDIFSLGVMFYELFSRTLLIYTHTPANSPADCERYASQIAQGFRPRRPKVIPAELWELIESCWEQDPADRPTAAEVLRKLRDLLKAAESSAGGKGSAGKGFSKLFSKPGANDSDSSPASSKYGSAADQKGQAQQQQDGGATAGGAATPGAAAARRQGKAAVQQGAGRGGGRGDTAAEPQGSCGCVIC
jgi:serine/threonine protein kinase